MAINPGEAPRPTVLIVDDEPDIRDCVYEVLGESYPVILRANAPADAVQAIKDLRVYLEERAAYDRLRATGKASGPQPLLSETLALALGYEMPTGQDSLPDDLRRKATEAYGFQLSSSMIMYLDRMMPIASQLNDEFSAILTPSTHTQHAPHIIQESYRREFGTEHAAGHLAVVMMTAAPTPGVPLIVPGMQVAHLELIGKPFSSIDDLENLAHRAESALMLGQTALGGPYAPQDTHQ